VRAARRERERQLAEEPSAKAQRDTLAALEKYPEFGSFVGRLITCLESRYQRNETVPNSQSGTSCESLIASVIQSCRAKSMAPVGFEPTTNRL
jgi:hypothetical protein